MAEATIEGSGRLAREYAAFAPSLPRRRNIFAFPLLICGQPLISKSGSVQGFAHRKRGLSPFSYLPAAPAVHEGSASEMPLSPEERTVPEESSAVHESFPQKASSICHSLLQLIQLFQLFRGKNLSHLPPLLDNPFEMAGLKLCDLINKRVNVFLAGIGILQQLVKLVAKRPHFLLEFLPLLLTHFSEFFQLCFLFRREIEKASRRRKTLFGDLLFGFPLGLAINCRGKDSETQ